MNNEVANHLNEIRNGDFMWEAAKNGEVCINRKNGRVVARVIKNVVHNYVVCNRAIINGEVINYPAEQVYAYWRVIDNVEKLCKKALDA